MVPSWAQLSPGPSEPSFVPAALPALRTAWGQGLEWGEPGLGPSIWKETKRFVGISPVPASWEDRSSGSPGLLSSLTKLGHVQGLLPTLGQGQGQAGLSCSGEQGRARTPQSLF